jgi:hypothetical protein
VAEQVKAAQAEVEGNQTIGNPMRDQTALTAAAQEEENLNRPLGENEARVISLDGVVLKMGSTSKTAARVGKLRMGEIVEVLKTAGSKPSSMDLKVRTMAGLEGWAKLKLKKGGARFELGDISV